MRWTCPHCKRIMSTPDEELVQGWRLVRCSECKGFSMTQKPRSSRASKPAPRVVSARREELSSDSEASRRVPNETTVSESPKSAPASLPPPAPIGARKLATPPPPPLLILGKNASRTPIPEPLPELDLVAPSRVGRFAAPAAMISLGLLVIFAGVQIRETHQTRMAATAAQSSSLETGRTRPPISSLPANDSIHVGQASAIRATPADPVPATDAAHRPGSGEQR